MITKPKPIVICKSNSVEEITRSWQKYKELPLIKPQLACQQHNHSPLAASETVLLNLSGKKGTCWGWPNKGNQ